MSQYKTLPFLYFRPKVIMKNKIICKDTGEVFYNYAEYLKTKHWERKRIEVAKDRKYKCQICGKEVNNNFNIHHKTYKNIGNEPLKDLVFLCPSCHNNLHHDEYGNFVPLSKIDKNKKTKINNSYKEVLQNILYSNLTIDKKTLKLQKTLKKEDFEIIRNFIINFIDNIKE